MCSTAIPHGLPVRVSANRLKGGSEGHAFMTSVQLSGMLGIQDAWVGWSTIALSENVFCMMSTCMCADKALAIFATIVVQQCTVGV